MAETWTPVTLQNDTGQKLNATYFNRVENGIDQIDGRVASLEASASTFYNVKSYGAAGSGAGDDSQEVQAAIDAAAAAGGGTVFFPAGTYRCLTGLSLSSTVRLLGADRAATRLDFSAMTTPINSAAIYAAGTFTTLPSLSTAIVKGGSTITFSSAPTVSARDILWIWDSADFSFSPARDYYRAGEAVQAVSLATNTVTLAAGTYAGYASGSTPVVRRMNPASVSIANLSVTAKTGADGITLDTCAYSLLDNVDVTGSDWANISVRRSYEIEVRGCRAIGYTASIGLNYGLAIDSCQRVTVVGGYYDTTRHGISTGSSGTNGIPLRELVITGAVASSSSAGGGDTGMDLHGSSERVIMANCVFPNGVTLGGDHSLVTGCTIRGGGNGVAVYSGEMLGVSHHLVGNVIQTTAPIGDSQRMLVEFGFSSSIMNRDGGTLQIANNHLEFGDVRSAIPANGTYGIQVYWIGTNAHTNNECVISNNTITTNYTGSQLFYGMLIDGDPSTGFKTLSIRGNMLKGCGIQVRDIGAETCTIANNEVIGAANNGIYHRMAVTPAFTGGLVNVYGNMVRRSQGCGMELRADSTATIRVTGNTSINNNQVGGTGSTNTDSSLFVGTCANAIIEGNVLGDNQGSPTQTRVYAVDTITNLYERNNHNVGTVTTVNSTSITNEFDGYVNQAKTKEAHGTAAPASGTWAVGDVVWHSTPAASGSIGWVCTTAGSPGTWKTFGAISA